jgi:hypothetical protein
MKETFFTYVKWNHYTKSSGPIFQCVTHINLSPEEHLTDSQVICGILPLLHVPPPRGVARGGVFDCYCPHGCIVQRAAEWAVQ